MKVLQGIKTTAKEPLEKFRIDGKFLDYNIADFWSWNQSDLIENRNRGILAEFIVKQALGIKNPTRLEWDSVDLITEDGTKIEIKSAAYLQSWNQTKYSSIIFDIKPTKALLMDNKYSENSIRQADIYIFCLLHHKDKDTVDPMKLEQWTFYLVRTDEINKKLVTQKTIGLLKLESLNHIKCNYNELLEKLNETKRLIC